MNTYLFQPKDYVIKPPRTFILCIHNCTHYQTSEKINIVEYLEKYYFQFDVPIYYFDFNYVIPNSRSPPLFENRALTYALREGRDGS